jgi:hypothetical protein
VKPHYCKSNSVSYREATDRMRLSLKRLIEARAGLRAHRVAAVVWTLTAGYSKAWDQVFIDGLADLSGMDERSVRRGLKECEAAGALQWRATQWRRGTPSLVGLPTLDTGSQEPGLQSETGRDTGPHRPGYLEPRTEREIVQDSFKTVEPGELEKPDRRCLECGKETEPFFSKCRPCIAREERVAEQRSARLVKHGRDDWELRRAK